MVFGIWSLRILDTYIGTQPFLLIVRTAWIVTVHSPQSYGGVPTKLDEYQRILGVSSI